jgi:hypothetical protein
MRTYPAAKPYKSSTPAAGARSGVVHIVNNVMLADDDGSFNPLGTTLFPAWWLRKNDPARLTRNLAFAADCGIDYQRILCEVGGVSWEDRTVDPRDPDYVSILRDVIDEAFDVHGLRTELTVFGGGTGADPSMVIDKVLQAVGSNLQKIMDGEGVNENNLDLNAMLVAKLAHELSPVPVAYASTDKPPIDEQLVVATAYTVHLDRTLGEMTGEGAPLGERAIRQAWDLKDYREPGFHNEPIGPQSSVAETSDPRILAMCRVLAILCGCVGYVFHTGGGIRCGGAADQARGRSANLYDVPSYAALAAALRALDSVLPPDLPTWEKLNLGWQNAPWKVDSIWVDHSVQQGTNRLYSAVSAGRVVSAVVGVRKSVSLIAQRQLGDVQVYDPATGAVVQSQRCDAGSVLRIDGTSPGYVVIATA